MGCQADANLAARIRGVGVPRFRAYCYQRMMHVQALVSLEWSTRDTLNRITNRTSITLERSALRARLSLLIAKRYKGRMGKRSKAEQRRTTQLCRLEEIILTAVCCDISERSPNVPRVWCRPRVRFGEIFELFRLHPNAHNSRKMHFAAATACVRAIRAVSSAAAFVVEWFCWFRRFRWFRWFSLISPISPISPIPQFPQIANPHFSPRQTPAFAQFPLFNANPLVLCRWKWCEKKWVRVWKWVWEWRSGFGVEKWRCGWWEGRREGRKRARNGVVENCGTARIAAFGWCAHAATRCAVQLDGEPARSRQPATSPTAPINRCCKAGTQLARNDVLRTNANQSLLWSAHIVRKQLNATCLVTYRPVVIPRTSTMPTLTQTIARLTSFAMTEQFYSRTFMRNWTTTAIYNNIHPLAMLNHRISSKSVQLLSCNGTVTATAKSVMALKRVESVTKSRRVY